MPRVIQLTESEYDNVVMSHTKDVPSKEVYHGAYASMVAYLAEFGKYRAGSGPDRDISGPPLNDDFLSSIITIVVDSDKISDKQTRQIANGLQNVLAKRGNDVIAIQIDGIDCYYFITDKDEIYYCKAE